MNENKVMATLMEICYGHECTEEDCPGRELQCKDDNWTAHDSKGRMTYEIMDWIMNKMPGVWEKYLEWMWDYWTKTSFMPIQDRFIAAHKLSNFLAYLKTHKEEWAYVECSKRTKNDIIDCYYDTNCDFMMNCNGTGKIITPEYEEAIKEMEVEG